MFSVVCWRLDLSSSRISHRISPSIPCECQRTWSRQCSLAKAIPVPQTLSLAHSTIVLFAVSRRLSIMRGFCRNLQTIPGLHFCFLLTKESNPSQSACERTSSPQLNERKTSEQRMKKHFPTYIIEALLTMYFCLHRLTFYQYFLLSIAWFFFTVSLLSNEHFETGFFFATKNMHFIGFANKVLAILGHRYKRMVISGDLQ